MAVSGTFSGDWGGTVNGTTDEFGEVVLSTPPVKGLSFVAFCVDSAARPGWGWDVDGSTLCGDSNGGGAILKNFYRQPGCCCTKQGHHRPTLIPCCPKSQEG